MAIGHQVCMNYTIWKVDGAKPPKRWRFVRGNDKPRLMGVEPSSFPGGIDKRTMLHGFFPQKKKNFLLSREISPEITVKIAFQFYLQTWMATQFHQQTAGFFFYSRTNETSFFFIAWKHHMGKCKVIHKTNCKKNVGLRTSSETKTEPWKRIRMILGVKGLLYGTE